MKFNRLVYTAPLLTLLGFAKEFFSDDTEELKEQDVIIFINYVLHEIEGYPVVYQDKILSNIDDLLDELKK